MTKKYSKKQIILAGVIITLAFMLCACNLFQTVDEAENYNKEPLIDAYVSIEVNCKSILEDNNISKLKENKRQYVPEDGIILKKDNVQIRNNDTVFLLLMRLCQENNILVNHSYSSKYAGEYIVGINNLNEMDCGLESGWTYRVNDILPNYGIDKYTLKDGDKIEFRYICRFQ